MMPAVARAATKVARSVGAAGRGLSQSAAPRSQAPPVILLDKDGTLLDFDSMWTPWLDGNIALVTDQLADESRLPVQRALRLALAGDEQDTSIPVKVGSQSPVAHFAMEVIRDIAGQTLAATLDGCHDGVTPHWWAEEAARIMEVWSDEVDVRNVTPTPDAVEWCHNMRALGARLAICTSDNRPNTLATLETAGFDLDLFQVLLCGGDEGYLAKPHPGNIANMCADLNKVARSGERHVDAADILMVGDSPLDVEMGAKAGGRSVGVLTGVGIQDELVDAGAFTVLSHLAASPASATWPHAE